MSFSEMLFLVFLALIVFGPKRLPEIARKLGKIVGEFRRASNDFRAQIVDEVRKLELQEDVKSIGTTLKENVNTVSRMAIDQQVLEPVKPVVKAAERDSSFDTAEAEAQTFVESGDGLTWPDVAAAEESDGAKGTHA